MTETAKNIAMQINNDWWDQLTRDYVKWKSVLEGSDGWIKNYTNNRAHDFMVL